MAYMRGLVRVDRGVLHDRLATGFEGRAASFPGQPPLEPVRAIEKEVQIAVWRRIDARHAVDRPQSVGDLLRDRARRLPEPSREGEGHWNRDVAQYASGRR